MVLEKSWLHCFNDIPVNTKIINPNEPSGALKQPTFFSKFWFLLPVAHFL